MIVALALVSCQKPVNPPQSQVQRDQIIEICYKSIGQSADFFLEEMEKMVLLTVSSTTLKQKQLQ